MGFHFNHKIHLLRRAQTLKSVIRKVFNFLSKQISKISKIQTLLTSNNRNHAKTEKKKTSKALHVADYKLLQVTQ